MSAVAARAFLVSGLVQGVGFRPFVYRLAREERLTGDVRNTADGVVIRAWGAPAALARFRNRLAAELPPLAAIEAIGERPLAAADPPPAFEIVASEPGHGRAAITPDAAVCADCRRELFDPADRRHRYPFINSIPCGPRFSIVEGLPYDRPRTAMRAFAMCADCAREYADPADRRHHAEPIACPACGPRLWLEGAAAGARLAEGEAALAAAVRLLRDGAIVAVKGLGGFHLAVRADDADAVARLRARKRRPAKPFALMVRDLAVAGRIAEVSDAARRALTSAAAPIVLLPARLPQPTNEVVPARGPLPAYGSVPVRGWLIGAGPLAGVAPGLGSVGVMLPYTPLHVLLLEAFDVPLVMTSANRTGEPQVTELAAARERLAGVADAYLAHDRPIANRVDDSLVQIVAGGRRQVLRRARGLAPRPIRLPDGFGNGHPAVLALGGDIKSVFGMARGGEIVLSQHIGDLDNPVAAADLRRTLALTAELIGFSAERIVADPHPAYRSNRMAQELAAAREVPLDFVLHHHAHAASCMVEHGLPLDHPPILALALDGLGLGEDGALWGAELLGADYRTARRLGGLAPTALLGGDRAALEPWRNLVARLGDAFGDDVSAWPAPFRDRLAGKPVATLLAARRAGINAPPASSAGRLFDAVAAAVGLCADRQDYEGEAAMRLQAAAETVVAANGADRPYALALTCAAGDIVLDPAPLWLAIAGDLAAAVPAGIIAARFHAGLADGLRALVAAVRTAGASSDVVALTGGTFQNALLARLVRETLQADGLSVIEHGEVPANDGGLAVGQAAIAIARMLPR